MSDSASGSLQAERSAWRQCTVRCTAEASGKTAIFGIIIANSNILFPERIRYAGRAPTCDFASMRRPGASLTNGGRHVVCRIVFAMKINVLVLDGAFDLGLSAVLDAFQTANELIAMSALAVPRFEVRTVGVRKAVRTAQGLKVPVAATGWRTPDCVVVPAIGFKMPGPLEQALTRRDIRDAGASLRHWAHRGATMSAACIGTFVLAESGLLDRHHATTTWWLAPLFRQRYPQVLLDESNMIVKSGKLVTAGAALSHIDLALWLIRGVSPSLAALTAKYLIVDSRPSQSAYALTDHLVHSDALVQRFESWARSRLQHGFSLDEAADAVGASKRTLARRMQMVLGKSPLSYFQSLRVEHAVHLLKTSNASVDQVAARVGYSEGSILRVLLRRRLGLGIREIRRSAQAEQSRIAVPRNKAGRSTQRTGLRGD